MKKNQATSTKIYGRGGSNMSNAILLAIVYQLVIFPNVNASQVSEAVKVNDPMVVLINEQRKTYDVQELQENRLLDMSAKAKACDMVEKKYWSHNSPDGVTPWKFFDDAGYKYTIAGENLIKEVKTDEDGMYLIMHSEAHKANVIKEKYRDVGIGRCGNIIVQHFGVK